MLGCETILDRQHQHIAGEREVATQVIVAVEIANRPATAVEEHERRQQRLRAVRPVVAAGKRPCGPVELPVLDGLQRAGVVNIGLGRRRIGAADRQMIAGGERRAGPGDGVDDGGTLGIERHGQASGSRRRTITSAIAAVICGRRSLAGHLQTAPPGRRRNAKRLLSLPAIGIQAGFYPICGTGSVTEPVHTYTLTDGRDAAG